MVFQGEDIVLEEDIIKKERFIRTESEWAAKNRRQVAIGMTSSAGAATLFTVPSKETFFLTGLIISGRSVLDTEGSATITMTPGISGGDGTLANLMIAASGQQDSLSISFPMPLKIESGTLIEIREISISRAAGVIFGWLEPKQI